MPKSPDSPALTKIKRAVHRFMDDSVADNWNVIPETLAEATLIELIFHYAHKPRTTLNQIVKDLGMTDVLKDANE